MTPPGTHRPNRPIRVVQWTTGNVGRRSLEAIIGRDDLELVGVYAHGADKVGRDAAELCGVDEPTGITATGSLEEILALEPDACCYNPLWSSTDELVALLSAGVNVCSTAGMDHRWQAARGRARPGPRGVRCRWQHDVRLRCAPRRDQHGRDGAQRRVQPGRRGTDHRVGRLLDVRLGGHADRDGLLAGPRYPGPGRVGTPRERGVRRVGGDDGRRDGRDASTG